MSLENYTGNISDLVATNPTGTDPRSQGDDHLRGIKYTLKQSFPLATGPVRVSGDKLFAGDSADNTKNFVIDASADNGTMKIARESGQDIMTVDTSGNVAFPVDNTNTNASGISIKQPDGTLLYFGNLPSGSIAAQAVGFVTANWAIPFVGDYSLVVSCQNTAPVFDASVEQINASSGRCHLFNTNTGAAAETVVSFIAIGRWR